MTEAIQPGLPGVPPPPRPGHSPESKLAGALAMARQLHKSGHMKSCKLEEIAEDLVAAAENGSTDGYEVARFLDDECQWQITTDMVEDLDSLSSHMYSALADLQKRWVQENNIQPPFPVGAHVHVKWRREPYTGVIASIDDSLPASYRVVLDVWTGVQKRCVIVQYENVLGPVEPDAAAA